MQKGTTLKGITQKGITQIGITQNGMKQKGNMQNPGPVSLRVFWAKHHSAVKVSFRVPLEEMLKNYVFSIRFIYSIHVIKV